MRTLTLNVLLAALIFSALPSFAQKKGGGGLKWTRVYTSEGRRLEVPETWTTQESERNGVKQLLAINPNKTIYMCMFFFQGEQTAGERMGMMVNHNNIDVVESATETFGSLKVMSKKGKMNYNGKKFKVLLATADGAGNRFNVVGAFWGPDEAFKKHKDKFETFFTSLD